MAKSKSKSKSKSRITSELSKFCTPLQIFIILAFISTLTQVLSEYNMLGKKTQRTNNPTDEHEGSAAIWKLLIVRIIYYALFGLILHQLCNHGKLGMDIAWLIILFPFLIELLSIFTSSLTTIIHGPSDHAHLSQPVAGRGQ